ncbi:MAG: STAS domain-containing protein [Patescibacteria group bacterium]
MSNDSETESKPAEIKITDISEGIKMMTFGCGYVDFSVCDVVSQAFEENNDGESDWFFNLNDLSFIDSEGVKTILACIRKVMDNDCRGVIICSNSSRPYRVLNILGITKSSMIFKNDVQYALQ